MQAITDQYDFVLNEHVIEGIVRCRWRKGFLKRIAGRIVYPAITATPDNIMAGAEAEAVLELETPGSGKQAGQRILADISVVIDFER
jgi:hypothetical protein